MAYCHLLAYFEAIEESADEELSLTLANVRGHGGTDTHRDRALVLGKGIFGYREPYGARLSDQQRRQGSRRGQGQHDQQAPVQGVQLGWAAF